MLTKIKNLFTKEDKSVETDITDHTDSNKNQVSDNVKTTEILTDKKSFDTSEQTNKTEEKPLESIDEKPAEFKSAHSPEEIKEEVIKVLKTCYDPEIPVDVWELGLIYEINVATNGDVLIVMTLTSPSCPVAGILPGEIETRIKEHPMVNDCKVQLTFDPPWSQRNMSEVAKLELGFL